MSFVDNIKDITIQNAPRICVYLGLVGFTKTVVDTYLVSGEIKKDIENYKKSKNKEKLNVIDYTKATWKHTVPLFVKTIASGGLIIAGDHMHNKRTVALAAAYSISASTLSDYKLKIKELIPDEKVKELEDKVAQAKVDNNPKEDRSVILTGDGDFLIYEEITGRYFKSNWNKVQLACNELVGSALGQVTPCITVSDWLDALGIPTTIYSDNIGWPIYKGNNHRLYITASSALTEDNKPCISIHYENLPEALY